MQRIRSGLYRLEAGSPANVYLIEGPQGLTMVDAGGASCGEALLQEMKGGGFRPEDLQQVVVTHAHADHFGGLGPLLSRRRLRVLAHPEDIPALRGTQPLPPHPGLLGPLIGAWRRASCRPRPLDVLIPVEPGRPLRVLPQWMILHTPGHTRGSLSLFEPARGILLCGDLFEVSRGGGLRLTVHSRLSSEAAGSLKRLSELGVDVICPGHGPVAAGASAFTSLQELSLAAA